MDRQMERKTDNDFMGTLVGWGSNNFSNEQKS